MCINVCVMCENINININDVIMCNINDNEIILLMILLMIILLIMIVMCVLMCEII